MKDTYNPVLRGKNNSIAVVKAKQCSPAENDGFILVQSGTALQISEAADRLTKKTVHPEIESDYERNVNKIQFQQNNNPPSCSKMKMYTGIKKNNHKLTSNFKHKRRKQSPSETASIELLGQFDNTDGESNDSEDEQPGNNERYVHPNQSTTHQTPTFEYELPGVVVVDLLQKSGVKEHANHYVTYFVDILFKPAELLAMETKDIPKHERYILLKEAVRNKFHLTHDELETMWI
ncbi:unnamed protein product [Rotaria socialis]|uniref:Uncharacterized protein n=2 Tax=Rotaria socialis TaxID=392032 RepID=A0A817XPR0_9BILA|nr:unnamed protein product [Rotaria socialis]